MSNDLPQNIPVILAAVAMELRPLRARLPLLKIISRRKPLKLELRQSPSGPILMGLTGMGPARAERAMEYLLTHHQPSVILSVGFVGALQESLQIGDVIFADGCYRLADSETLTLEAMTWPQNGLKSFPPGLGLLKPSNVRLWHRGCLISSPEIVTQSSTKRQLGATLSTATKPVGVEMETAALLRVMERRSALHVPFLSFRTISDTLHEDLNIDFNRLQKIERNESCGPGSSARPRQREGVRIFSSITYFLKNPRAAWRLRRLVRHAQKAAESLAQNIYQLFETGDLGKMTD